MGYRAMQLRCYCGQVPDRILEVGFTSDRHLVVHFWCSSCSRVLFRSLTPNECDAACPLPDAEVEMEFARADARFLESLGITMAE